MESHNDECLRDELELLSGIILAVIVSAILGFLVGVHWSEREMTKAEIISKLDATDKRNIAIDFMAHSKSWDYTLHNLPPMDADKAEIK